MSHPRSLNRREFAGLVAKAAAGSLALGAALPAARAATPPAASAQRGIYKTVRRPKILEAPLDVPAGETWRYMLNYPLQIAPNTAALYLNMKQCGGPGQDFEGGVDIIVFDQLDAIRPEKAIKVSRQHLEPNPNFGGKMSVMAKYPGNIGFIPLGAKLPDGRPHPHAGTGFAIVVTAAWPTDRSNGYATYPDRIGLTAYLGEKRYRTLEIYQLAYDGRTFTVGKPEVLTAHDLVPGVKYEAAGMGCAITDGEDLLIGMKATRQGATAATAGLTRWARRDARWQAVGYEPVTPEDNSLEPSVVRDLDGSLLFATRGPRSMGPPLRVWRQAAAGAPWEKRIHLDRMLPSTPVAIGQAVDGTPFIMGNLWQPEFRLPEGLYSDGGISRLEPVGWRGERSTICLWPLNEARNGLDAELVARDPRSEFGPPPHGTVWALDHPIANRIRLADNVWRCVMGYRMLEWKENTH
ncbi:MAG: hypothetical protein JNG83_05970, partial [Opitutaceae bacterium]|nr:hypothetical protein [Opitutaceae bacterium]